MGVQNYNKLNTIQKRENLNSVYSVDAKGNGGANHKYSIVLDKGNQNPTDVRLSFQDGSRFSEGSTSGILDSDLLEIVRDRLKSFQEGDFATDENKYVIMHLEEALMWMNRRVEDRIERNVLGKNLK